jgi:fimbrial chaperone protein
MPMTFSRYLQLVLLLSLLPLAGVQAAGLQVSPILLEFGATDTAQILWLANSSSTPLRAQVRVQRWSQSTGEEFLEPSRELVASPPLLEIAPGERQRVRLVRLDSTPPDQEQSYRLLIDELPSDLDAASAPGLQFLLQYSLPVFVGTAALPAVPEVGQGPVLEAELLLLQGQAAVLRVRNTGKRRARLSDLILESPDGSASVLASGLLGYVLAGQQMQWPVDLPGNVVDATLKVMLNDEPKARTLLILRENR